MALAGSGEVNANTRAAAIGSARILNSPTGVIFPGSAIAPPITQTLFARRRDCGDSEAARAMVVIGPITTMSIVSTGLSSRMWRISRCDGRVDGLNKEGCEVGSIPETLTALAVSKVSPGGLSNKVFQVCSGLVCWGCYTAVSKEVGP